MQLSSTVRAVPADAPQVTRIRHSVLARHYRMTDALEALQVHASGLRCWYNGEEICVALNEEDARQQLRETLGFATQQELDADGWQALPLDSWLAYRSDAGAPWTQKETWRWIKDFGPGWLGSFVRS